LLLLLFLLAFLVEALVIGRRSGAPEFRFEIERLGRSAGVVLVGTVVLAVSALTGCGDSTLERAHHANELGITEDAARSFGPARTSFERSIGFGEQAEIPTYNLGRTLIRAGSFSEAHEVLQRALELDPELIAAYFNDGIALYRLGREERDPRDCDLRRTRDLWLAARDRFELTIERAGENAALTEAGRANLTAMRAALTELERLIADPPPECLQSSADASAGGGSGGGGGGGGSTPELPPGAAAGGGRRQSPEPLSASEHESVNEALDRIARQRMEDGKYHRRTLAEQFPPSAWANPDPEIWW
jgi:tetratricopeptide (TPR) repeat protein